MPEHIASKEIDSVEKLKNIELVSKELIEMRANITKYGDLNLLQEVRNIENAIDRRRKGERTKKMQNEQKQEKLKRQMKGNFSI